MVKLLFAGASSSTPRVPYPHSNSISSSSNTRGVGGWNLGEETGSVVKLEGNFFDDRSGSIVAAAGTGTGCAASPMLVSASSLQLQQRPTQQVKKSNPSTCMFWCAVALGGLTQGQPIENVSDTTLYIGLDVVSCVHVYVRLDYFDFGQEGELRSRSLELAHACMCTRAGILQKARMVWFLRVWGASTDRIHGTGGEGRGSTDR